MLYLCGRQLKYNSFEIQIKYVYIMRKIQSLRKLLPLVGGGNRSVFLRFTLFMLMLVTVQAGWADTTIKTLNFTSWTEQSTIDDGSTIDGCYFKGAGSTITNSDGLAFNNNMKVNNYYVAIPLENINGSITVTITGVSRPSFRYAISSNAGTITECNDITRPSSGTSVTFTVSDISSSSTYLCLGRNGSGNTIKTVTVTTPDAASLIPQRISIADLRFDHNIYNPSRTNIAGFNITTSGWLSYTNTKSSPYTYSLLLGSSSLSDNAITISTNSANSARKIKQIVLIGANGSGTFTNTTPSSSDTYGTTNADQIVWQNETGANSVTISLTCTDRPAISEIWVYTDAAMTWSKQNVTLAFSPASGSANVDKTDHSIDGRVVISGTSEYFRPDDFSASSVTNSGSAATFNQYHVSTGKVGINTGSSAGVATITAAFSGNDFYNAATSGTYTLNIVDASTHTASITVDDMRFSKTADSGGLSAADDLNRKLGGFAFTFEGADGLKFNNGDFLIFRVRDTDKGKVTITPVKNGTGTVTINRVDISTMASYTNGVLSVKGGTEVTLEGVSSHTFDAEGGYGESFYMEAKSGDIYVTGFTIYYTDPSGVINTMNVTPEITFSKASDNIKSGGSLTSPTITTNPANFDISASSSNTNVATVSLTNWAKNGTLVTLQGESGTAVVTASAAASTYFGAATDTYTVTVAEASSEQSEKWNFTTLNVANTITNDTGWNGVKGWSQSGDYYQNVFTSSDNSSQSAYAPVSPSQLQGLKFGRKNSSGLADGQIRLYSSYMQFRNSSIWVDVPVSTTSDKVIVTFDGGNSTTQAGFDIFNATVEGDATATSITSDATQTTVTLEATTAAVDAGYVRLQCNKSNVKLYRIQVSTETRGTLTMRDTSNSYEKNVGTGTTPSTDNHFNHRVLFTPSDALTYANDATNITVTSTDPTVLDVSSCNIMQGSFGQSSSFYIGNIIPKKAGTAELVISFAGNNNYKPTSYTSQTYTVYGPTEFLVQVEDQEIQQGQFSLITPIITDADGNALGIKEMSDGSGRYTTYVLDDEEDIPDYSNYFTFTYTPGEGSGENYEKITMDGTIDNKVLTEDTNDVAAAVGAYRKITISATPISNYQSAFTTGSTAVTATATMTIIEKTKNPQMNLYWDAACTDTYKITEIATDPSTGAETWGIKSTVAEQASDKQWIVNKGDFSTGFPNGRMLYVQVTNPGDSIWFSYGQNEEASTIPANPSLNKSKRIFQYRRGIPIYIDDDLSGSDYVTVNIVATSWNASTQKRILNGSVARLKFPKIAHSSRPAEPTYDPVSPDATASENKDGRKIMNTSENVVAYGEGASKGVKGNNNLVYGKFSTGSVYSTEQLINEANVQKGEDNVPVISTEVAKRRFTAVQIKTESPGNDYISTQTYTEYWYLYDTDLRITPERYDININTATTESPSYTVTWYNKKTGKNQKVDSYDDKITYEIASCNGASDATLNPTTGIVTAGSEPGWVRVKITYTGGEQHGGVSGEPQYTSTTDESSAYYYVYITNPATEQPVITPTTRNFTGTLTYTITAPTHWNVYYTTNGTTPAYGTGTLLTSGSNPVSNTIGEGMDVNASVTVKAIAYNPENTSQTSVVVSETYTKKAALPNPIFDPDGTVSGGYKYNTSDLTVSIACAYAGSVIYYTIGESSSIDDPVIGAENTYRYSGLSKVTVTGNKYIKAVAYDPENEIFSNVVTAYYYYSDNMNQPYFQISDNGGNTWKGEYKNGETVNVTPSTQIRIIDPNPTKGTIFYTLDGSTPADNATTMVYTEGNPFTVGKTTTGKAITILEDAHSAVASATFTMDARYNVWEAVDATLNDVTIGSNTKKGINAANGFIISNNNEVKELYADSNNNNGTMVNKRSLSTSDGGTGTKTFAQQYITATFGGYDHNDWEQMVIADAAIGTPLDAVGTYNIRNSGKNGEKKNGKEINNGNAQDETQTNYNHAYMTRKDGRSEGAPATHDKTFTLPATGTYVRFEPETDGDLTVWVLQQGSLLYEDDRYLIDNVIRLRPVYLIDEQGKSYQVKKVNGVEQVWSAARLSENWSRMEATAATGLWMQSGRNSETGKMIEDNEEYIQYLHLSDGKLVQDRPSASGVEIVESISGIDTTDPKYYKKLINKGTNRSESAHIYQLIQENLEKNHVKSGDPIKPFAIHTGTIISQNAGSFVDSSDDGTGYVLASGGYAKYTFEVKAGKTYYFMGVNTKIGIRGFQFVPATSPEKESITLADTGANDGISTVANNNVTDQITLTRDFTANQYTALLLPFSMSATQVEKTFGKGTTIVHFNKYEDKYLYWKKHSQMMIVAGTPVLIYPTKSISGFTVEAQIEKTTADDPMGNTPYIFNGTYNLGQLNKYDVFINNRGNTQQWVGKNGQDYKSLRAWLTGFNSTTEARSFFSSIAIDDDLTTAIPEISFEAGVYDFDVTGKNDNNIYNINGMLIRRNAKTLEGLQKGVYIVSGKKVVVK